MRPLTAAAPLLFCAAMLAAPAQAQVTFYEHDNFGGRSFTAHDSVVDFLSQGFNDRASSAVVVGASREVCVEARFGGECVVLAPGRYPSLGAIGLNDRISSARMVATAAVGQIRFFERPDFEGRSFATAAAVDDLRRHGFNDRAASLIVEGGAREVCEDIGFRGRCVLLRAGRYASLVGLGLEHRISSVSAAAAAVDPRPAAMAPPVGQVSFYEREQFAGASFTTVQAVADFSRFGFNDRASSAIVVGQPREVCDDVQHSGRCVVLVAGRYPSLAAMGLNNRVSSVRPVAAADMGGRDRVGPPVPSSDGRRGGHEPLYEAEVISVRALPASAGPRCADEPVAGRRGEPNVPGAIAGAVLGGILGHQVGGGSGKDIATVGGAVAGAVIGANVGRGSEAAPPPPTQRCADPAGPPAAVAWEVVYRFRGVERRTQLNTRPGPTITVNAQGEPRP